MKISGHSSMLSSNLQHKKSKPTPATNNQRSALFSSTHHDVEYPKYSEKMVIISHSHNPHFTINGYCYFDDSHGDDDKSIW
jgi:hypothetical protein